MSTRAQRRTDSPKQKARQVANSTLVEQLTRLGYMIRGLVYGMIGFLAFQVAIGKGGSTTDQRGAIEALRHTSAGGVLMVAILIGLIGYSLWGVIRASLDPLRKGSDAKGIAYRVGYLVSGISYGLLAITTYSMMTGSKAVSQNNSQSAQTQDAISSILSKSWGPWAVGIVAALVIGFGLSQIYMGAGRNFERLYKSYELSSSQRKWIDRLGRFGTAARGVVFLLVGLFLFLAAYHNDPHKAKGIDGVLTDLLHHPYGPWLLGVVALGLDRLWTLFHHLRHLAAKQKIAGRICCTKHAK